MPRVVEVAFPPMHSAQKEVFDDSSRFQVVAGGRRLGKTALGVMKCIRTALDGGRTWWVAPSLGNADEGWSKLTQYAHEIPDTKVLLGERTVVFPGGGKVQIRTASEPHRLRGPGLDGLVLDEASFIKPEAWGQVLRPALADRRGWALFISTPFGKKNWFYDLFMEAEELDGWRRWQVPTSANPAIDPEEIEAARRVQPPDVFAQEFLAEFTVPGGQVFRVEWLRYFEETENYYVLDSYMVSKDDCWRFSTVDLAASTKESADYTVISTWAVTPRGDLILIGVVREKLEAPDITPKLQDVYDEFKPGFLGIEKNGLGLPIVQYAQRTGLPIRPIDVGRRPLGTVSTDKTARTMPVAARMESGMVWLPRGNPRIPMGEIEREILAFPSSQHDDFVDTLSLAGIELAGGMRVFDVGNLAESSDPFGFLDEDLGFETHTEDMVETESFSDEAWSGLEFED